MKKTVSHNKGIALLPMLWVALFTLFFTNTHAADSWTLECPPDQYVDCNAELWDLTIYGQAYIHTHYGTQSAGAPVVKYYLNSCGSGYITRTWMAEDPYWNWISCTQTIHVGSGGAFGYSNIQWPADASVTGCNPNTHPDVTGRPTWDYVQCSMIGVSYKDMVFTVNNGCKKIMRTWTLLDWCANNSYYNTFTHKQFIKITSDESPDITCIDDIIASATDCKKANVIAPPLVVDPSTCGGNFKITNNSPYATNKGADISGVYPVGTTKVTLTVEYGCGNRKSCYVNVTVKNDKPPVAICLQQITVALMGLDTDKDGVNDQGMVDIWAKDLDWKSYSPCGFNPLRFSFSEDSVVMSRTFTCDHLGVNEINMYVWDKYNNTSYCKVKVDVQNNSANITPCERLDTTSVQDTAHTRLVLSGKIASSNGDEIESMSMILVDPNTDLKLVTKIDTQYITHMDSFINLSGVKLYFFEVDTVIKTITDSIQGTEITYHAITDHDGVYVFEEMIEEGGTYMVKCGAYEKELSHIDKDDLDMLTDFILGSKTFDHPAQYLAADVNSDGKINMEDLSMMISYLRGDITSFEQNHVLYKHELKYETSPSSVLGSRLDWVQIEKITASIEDLDFVLVQKGDLTATVSAQSMDDTELRSAEAYIDSRSYGSISSYPNPFNESVSFQIQCNYEGLAQLTITDVSGRVVNQSSFAVVRGHQQFKVNLSDQASGILYYQVLMNDHIYTGKIMKL